MLHQFHFGLLDLTGKDQVYFDRHELPDIVEYRVDWAEQKMERHIRTEIYPVGSEDKAPIQPELRRDEKTMVLVTHDEFIFYSNDCKMTRWVEDKETFILPKGQYKSIMASSFMCPCHGTMRGVVDSEEVIPRVIFVPGQNNEGWWANKYLVEQLKKLIVLFVLLHPDRTGVFAFDQSSNHKAMAEDALTASRINSGKTLHKEGSVKYRDTSFINKEGMVVLQSLYTTQSFDADKVRREIKRRKFNDKDSSGDTPQFVNRNRYQDGP
ncbi:hypothetical protein G6F56_000295 [Rhizopus delemar]|nr:hypothetical protein G6F56_000295 [Rhizopus delemar]